MTSNLIYNLGDGVVAFSPLRDAGLPFPVVQAHQLHSDRVAKVTSPLTTREELEGIDEEFFSARREGVACGRIINTIKLI